MESKSVQLFLPLEGFEFDEDEFELSDDTRIVKSCGPSLRFDCLLDNSSKKEISELSYVDYWLHIDWDDGNAISSSEIANLAQLSLWMAKPTRTRITHRFERISHSESNFTDKAYRILSKFSYVDGDVFDSMGADDLRLAMKLYKALREVNERRGRIAFATSMTLTGCWSDRWHVSHICRAVAAEALLTFGHEFGITKKLAKTYACFVASAKHEREAAFKNFEIAYRRRSAILHGREMTCSNIENVASVAEMQKILRRIWQTVLMCPDAMSVLDSSDAEREVFFSAMSKDFHPPQTN